MKCTLWNLITILILINPASLLAQESRPSLLEPVQIRNDIDTLVSTMKKTHPTYKSWYESNNIDYLIDSIRQSITKPISELEFFRIMQPYVAIDGHTSLLYYGPLYDDEDSPLIPFRVVIYDNNLYVKKNYSGNALLDKGAVIEKINGIPSKEIINNLYRYISGEKETYKARRLEEQFHVLMALVYGSFSSFTVTVNNSTLNLHGVGWGDFQEPSKPNFELRFYDDNIAYIYKKMFMPPWGFLDFIDSAYAVIAEREIDYVIIDNLSGPGLTDLADTLISYFAKNPYRLMEQKMTRVSALSTDLIKDKKDQGNYENGYFIQDYPLHHPARKNFFSGNTYIPNGPRSYSTGTCFPAAAKCYQNAIIVGEESGQPLLSNGDQNQFVLPETKITCITSLAVIYMPCNNGDTVNGVIPDYIYTPTLQDRLGEDNYTLDYTLKLIRENQ